MINQDITRKIKTDGQYFGLHHTFGKADLSLQNDDPVKETRIRLLDSFQESYLAKSDMDRSHSQSELSKEPKELKEDNSRLNKLKDELYRNMVESQTRKCLVQMQRTVNDYLLQRLRLYKDRTVPKAGAIRVNRISVPDGGHLTAVAKQYMEAAIEYDKKLSLLSEMMSD